MKDKPHHIDRLKESLGTKRVRIMRDRGLQISGRTPSRNAVQRYLISHGLPAADPIVDFLVLADPITFGWLKLGRAPTRYLLDVLRPEALALAVPIGLGPSDAIFWIDTFGIIYDDTDMMRCTPVGTGLAGLVDYWIGAMNCNRWSGGIHGYITQVQNYATQDLAKCLDTREVAAAIGPNVVVWPERVAELCASRDGVRKVFEVSATFSAPNAQSFLKSLHKLMAFAALCNTNLVISQVCPSFPLAHHVPENIVARIVCKNAFHAKGDGYLCICKSKEDKDVFWMKKS